MSKKNKPTNKLKQMGFVVGGREERKRMISRKDLGLILVDSSMSVC